MFGWRAEFQQMGPMQYTTFWNGDKRAAGMMALPSQAAGAPSHWMVYFAVADCDATVTNARHLGAKVLAPPMDIPDVGRFAVLQDPQGAVFSVIKMSAA
jgi:predicted enzyme related to lactoylglutathione lyase